MPGFVLVDADRRAVSIPDPSGGSTYGAGDFDRFVGKWDEDLPALGKIDPYNDTAFRRDQFDALLADIEHVNKRADLQPIEQRGLARLAALIDHAKNDPSTTLWYFGD